MKDDKERTKILSLRLRPDELDRLVAEAEAVYLPLSAYVRQRLFAQEPRTVEKNRRK